MTTKYYCDVCGKETKNNGNAVLDIGQSGNPKFDVCDECLTKPLKNLITALWLKTEGERIISAKFEINPDFIRGDKKR